jgi:hypothetical protein
MTAFRITILVVLLAGLGGCGGTDLTCDDVRAYQLAEEGKRIEAPDGLDDLDPVKEAPLPDASPRQEREPGSPCIDRPPDVTIGE